MCKIIGFAKKVDGYQTAVGFMNTKLFKNACIKTANDKNLELSNLCTKRQAGKFLKSRGIVFNHMNSTI